MCPRNLLLALVALGCGAGRHGDGSADGGQTDADTDTDTDTDSETCFSGTEIGSDHGGCSRYREACVCGLGGALGDDCSCWGGVLARPRPNGYEIGWCLVEEGCGLDATATCLDTLLAEVGTPSPDADQAIVACRSACDAPNDFCEKLGALSDYMLGTAAGCLDLVDCDAMKACYEAADSCAWYWFWPWVWGP